MYMLPVCVFCRRHSVEPAFRPFCSRRCKLQDLARWADGTYSVPAEPVPDVDVTDVTDDSLASTDDEGKR